ncbi:MAG: PDZ domain-containing protein [Verrucomicrobiales bacterium]|nr:PDZ domain-containing protein [Verrucomicrobiales bacterium]
MLAAGLLVLTLVMPSAVGAVPRRVDTDAAVDRVKPSVVRILVVTTSYSDGRELKSKASGSGVIVSKEGHIISNHHVAGRAVRIVCTLADREEVDAELIGTDPLTDICVLQLRPTTPREFPAAAFGDSSKLKVGDPVLAMGSPMSLSQSVTLGIVSNPEMILPRFFGPMARLRQEGEDVGSLVRWIGHDAPIYGGNSGGPLVNLKGEIVGINEISLGLAGAIPGNLARQVADQIRRFGRARRAWFGFEIQPLLKGASERGGVLVASVLEDSPAASAGLKAGDTLLSVAGKAVRARYEEEIPQIMGFLSDLPIGQDVPLVISRDQQPLELRMTSVEREEARPRQRELPAWGITARNLSEVLARELRRPSRDGVMITSVRSGGPAGEAKPQLQSQDILVEVNGQSVASVEDLVRLTEKLTGPTTGSTVDVLATFDRRDRRHVTVVSLGLRDLKDPGLEATKAWLPVETQVISRNIARQLGNPALKGFYITRVYPDSVAAQAGLRVGDMIVAVDDEKLTADAPEHEEDLAVLIRQYDPGTRVKLGLLRGQERLSVEVALARSPHQRREMKKYRNQEFEFVARDLAFHDRAEEQWGRDQPGVMVEEVKSGSWAELGQLYSGDLLLEVAGQAIRDVAGLQSVMEKIAIERPRFVAVKVQRGIYTRFLELEPKWTP